MRAGWAAQLAQDAGLSHVLVLRQGVYGWRLDPAVKPYRGYRLQVGAAWHVRDGTGFKSRWTVLPCCAVLQLCRLR